MSLPSDWTVHDARGFVAPHRGSLPPTGREIKASWYPCCSRPEGAESGTRRGGADHMSRTFLTLSAFICLGLALGGSLAHLYELPHKVRLPADEYLIVQQIYQGWNRLGFAVGGAMLSTLALSLVLRKHATAFRWALLTFLAIAATQVVFWIWTYPVNVQTENWTTLPAHWTALRARWEYSHAAGAALNLTALATLVLAVLNWRALPR
jgi:hypothetical protein